MDRHRVGSLVLTVRPRQYVVCRHSDETAISERTRQGEAALAGAKTNSASQTNPCDRLVITLKMSNRSKASVRRQLLFPLNDN